MHHALINHISKIADHFQVVPVLPFSLVDRSGVAEKDGQSDQQSQLSLADSSTVQFWLSTLLVAFGLSLTFAARKSIPNSGLYNS